MNYDYDLIIIGGGLVGASLALALARSPLRIAVVDAQTTAERQSSLAGNRALALARGTVQILDNIGIWPHVIAEAMSIRCIHVSDRGHFGKTRLHASDKGVDALGYVVLARILEDALDDALDKHAFSRLRPARLVGIKAGEEAIETTFKRDGDELHLTSRLLVAADGGHSSVREMLGIAQDIREYGQTALVAEVQTEKDPEHVAFERFTACGPLAMLPLRHRTCSLVWTLSDQRAVEVLSLSDRDFVSHLQPVFGTWLGQIEATSVRTAFPLKMIRAKTMIDNRVVLIGNAMHQIHPVAGQGFNLGLRDAASLAERLKDQYALGGDIGGRTCLKTYAQARHNDLNQVVHFTDSLVGIFSNDLQALGLARNLALVVLDRLPPVKRLLTQRAMGYGVRL